MLMEVGWLPFGEDWWGAISDPPEPRLETRAGDGGGDRIQLVVRLRDGWNDGRSAPRRGARHMLSEHRAGGADRDEQLCRHTRGGRGGGERTAVDRAKPRARRLVADRIGPSFVTSARLKDGNHISENSL